MVILESCHEKMQQNLLTSPSHHKNPLKLETHKYHLAYFAFYFKSKF